MQGSGLSTGVKRVAVLAVVVAAAWLALRNSSDEAPAATPDVPGLVAQSPAASLQSASSDRSAFNQAASGTSMRVTGRVERLLPDDNDGSRHQRFIIRVDPGITLLIAHNIDLAPRLEGLASGDAVEVYGEYEWNDRGGLLHWTHKDPGGRHVAGYIEWRGRRYQ
jgi:hypothetical protein